MKISRQQLIEDGPKVKRAHVVLLGAGASFAAFPNGDAKGKRLPLMRDLVATLELHEDLLRHMPELRENIPLYDKWCGNFEACYSELYATDPKSALLRTIEAKVEQYFEALELPPHATLYDQLVLSLRGTDSILTFNWDPFLVDAWVRNAERFGSDSLPTIHHLHGNVRLGYCQTCRCVGSKNAPCPVCGGPMKPSRLLYPVGEKDYESDPLIKSQWDAAREAIQSSFILTIFGYSAPISDAAARGILKDAWREENGTELVRRMQIIDIRNADELAESWSGFPFHLHYDTKKTLRESLLGRYPRRSCEALYHCGVKGKYVEGYPFEQTLGDLQDAISSAISFES